MISNEWNRAKRKKKTVEIVYSPDSSMLSVKKVIGKHLESMGLPSKSGYELYPEEAVYLMETGSAIISTVTGSEMSLLEVFSILESNAVSINKYEIYKQLKSTGLVVLRPRKNTIELERFRHVKSAVLRTFAERTFNKLVEMNNVPETSVPNATSFPCYSNENGQLVMQIKFLHTDPSLVNFLSSDILDSFPASSIVQSLPPPTQRSTKSCRPSYCPLIGHVNNWSEYRFQIEKVWQAKTLKKLKKLRPSTLAEQQREKITIENVDFHVFSPAAFSHRLPARPLFSIICYSASGPILKTPELGELRNVVLALEEAGKVNYTKLSGAPVELNDYLC